MDRLEVFVQHCVARPSEWIVRHLSLPRLARLRSFPLPRILEIAASSIERLNLFLFLIKSVSVVTLPFFSFSFIVTFVHSSPPAYLTVYVSYILVASVAQWEVSGHPLPPRARASCFQRRERPGGAARSLPRSWAASRGANWLGASRGISRASISVEAFASSYECAA
jgi:hypothetical protein